LKAFAFFPPSLLPIPTILLAGLLEILNKLNDKLEALQLALEQYLETKRRVFPRLYFVSNDDILEILAHSKRPDLMQPHIRKLFANIKSLKLSKVILRLSILLYLLPLRKRIVSRLLISHLSVLRRWLENMWLTACTRTRKSTSSLSNQSSWRVKSSIGCAMSVSLFISFLQVSYERRRSIIRHLQATKCENLKQ